MRLLKALICLSSILIVLAAFLINTDCFSDYILPAFPEIDLNKKWNFKDVSNDQNVKPMTIKVPGGILNSTRDKLLKSVILPSIPESNFKYGFNSNYLEIIIKYWSDKYIWRQWEDKINGFPHFFTTVNGLQIHFIHIKPKLKRGQRSVPILLLHGWPGSFFEYYKVIPQLVDTQETEGIAFEVVCPSLPGFGWSDAPQLPGHGFSAISGIMFNLMDRLNVTEKFFIQGGDFGSLIAAFMSKLNPSKVAGIHVNLPQSPYGDIRYWLKVSVGAFIPSRFHFLSIEEQKMVYPVKEKFVSLLSQMGYFWIQATKPSTIGVALSNNPVGLAAYMLEKFGAWSNDLENHLNSANGGIEDLNISKDELITNIMIYHVTNSISSSVRLYKESWSDDDNTIMNFPVKVPTGIALFPNEIIKVPREFAKYYYRDIRQFTYMPKGGHFAALEEPTLLAEDIRSFVNEVVFNAPL